MITVTVWALFSFGSFVSILDRYPTQQECERVKSIVNQDAYGRSAGSRQCIQETIVIAGRK